MEVRKFLFRLFVNMLIFSFVVTLVRGIVMPVGLGYLFGTLIIVALAMMLYAPILRFLTIRINFLTQFITVGLLVFGALNLLQSFMPEFRLVDYVIGSQNLQIITISSITLTKVATAGLIGGITGLISAIMENL